ncbi:MAG: alpha/beta hydrolase [Massilibacteroides sp.]|nr:alpha/beta hydrolase [Massilibacteroides sp.]MDD3061325.1 alpha/beta hydrolase [Massilibacteroides sp.]MDD4114923.1 alpha/beta hydrolase [Massilibacteroides sp.]MDD4659821.1 alpha/beta hydrolase [Massilibacteroides sp.]
MIQVLKRIIVFSCCSLFFVSLHAQYVPDILKGYEQQTIQMTPDYDGDVVCTLIRKPLSGTKQAVLYIHGYNDYFFQYELGDSIQHYGFDFYALDLRKYGRSIRPHQRACFCKNINEYFADIDTALNVIRQEGHTSVFLLAHSTGGLITPLYLDSHKERKEVKGLMLNSPFFDMNMSWFKENIAIPVIAFFGRFFPNWIIEKEGFSFYSESLLVDKKGEWIFNTNWKRPEGYPKTAGWLRAIHQGHTKLQKGLSLSCPVWVLSSDKSFSEKKEWHDQYKTSDIVLDVNDIQRIAPKLGSKVRRDTIPNGIHDLILSARPYRETVYKKIRNWLVVR